jgi:murein DD-endopeptidase MepM/ murein hydrolase activator NlpD
MHWLEVFAITAGISLIGFALTSPSDDNQIPNQVNEGSIELNLDNQADAFKPIERETASSEIATYNDQIELVRQELALEWDGTELSDTPDSYIAERTEELTKETSVTVKSGDTLSAIFSRQGFSAQDVFRVMQNKTAADQLKNIRPGKQLIFVRDDQKQLKQIKYVIAVNQTLIVDREGDKFYGQINTRPIEIRQAFASGVITNSLFNAGKQAGLSDTLIIKLANIFGWDIDFVLDVRANDSFAMVYQQRYLDGEFIGDGEILAAQFVNQGQVFKAVRYKDNKNNENFYSPNGDSMRKAFLRTPVNFLYISSSFKPRRFHPILKRWKAHRGIDYRAPTGTPVYASGDGKVIASSYNKYNGKYIFIQHGNNIVTKYLHLSRRAVSRGKRVKQGQVIGYVGSTGMSEAPHLHYEFLVNGVHRNPRTVTLPKAQPIASSQRQDFKQKTRQLLANLDARTRLTSNLSGGK